ncbi:hypothetical protein D1605_006070 [Xylella fastidiosa subsp. fastidiosa]|jgi:hypothetical protein|uniref:Uncharacterized protein n=2 Tax=Xylella fastidiosa TaxID=2371 RepID=B2I5H7_XYLF2|nr:hypothetical protein [Xylella fastidiosa]KAF0570665.1 hypothetical protein P305_09035 [Xylella fastidiosa subsp. fastidiosa Mus-1]ACB92622.1 hypothetical protein XfasM23_1194 [Xylella fastidiosa M23]KFA40056.1 hypothetical protein DF22_003360 [Xylella fastidiosa]KGM19844.1 hypothetical protein JT24_06205 [Xylella fastidiosa]MBE0263138.1 hypothetical protein [Xylella fastidiosa subsp. fastidiosa]
MYSSVVLEMKRKSLEIPYGKRSESSKVGRMVLDLASEVVEIQEGNSREIARIKKGMKHGAAEGSRKFRI